MLKGRPTTHRVAATTTRLVLQPNCSTIRASRGTSIPLAAIPALIMEKARLLFLMNQLAMVVFITKKKPKLNPRVRTRKEP
jgi:hypothetical protein